MIIIANNSFLYNRGN